MDPGFAPMRISLAKKQILPIMADKNPVWAGIDLMSPSVNHG
jgi:hypothetical protein